MTLEKRNVYASFPEPQQYGDLVTVACLLRSVIYEEGGSMRPEAPTVKIAVERRVSPGSAAKTDHAPQREPGSLGPQPVRVLEALRGSGAPVTAGRLSAVTGMSRADVEAAVRELRAHKMLRTLNTVIETFESREDPARWTRRGPSVRPSQGSQSQRSEVA